jgi:hypothetical protein
MALFERRSNLRQSHAGQALLVAGSSSFAVEVLDISSGGCCVRRPSGFNLHIGDTARVFLFNGPGPAMPAYAEIRWFQDDQIGLQFGN